MANLNDIRRARVELPCCCAKGPAALVIEVAWTLTRLALLTKRPGIAILLNLSVV